MPDIVQVAKESLTRTPSIYGQGWTWYALTGKFVYYGAKQIVKDLIVEVETLRARVVALTPSPAVAPWEGD